MNQLFLALLSLVAAALSQSPYPQHQRYACVAGLAAQPFWLAETWRARQWGMLVLTCFYAAVWALSFYRQFLRAAEKAPT